MPSSPSVLCRLLVVLSIWAISTSLLYYAWISAPLLDGVERPTRLPLDFDSLKTLVAFLNAYRERYFFYTTLLFAAAYLYKQTFAIPGSFFMNIAAGAMLGLGSGLTLVSTLNAVGACFCYLLSRNIAAPVVERIFSARLQVLREKVSSERHRLFYFLLFARLFPFTPHWLLNICSPLVHIPIHLFFLSVWLGTLPYNFLCVRAGGLLWELRSTSQVLDAWTLAELALIALLMLGLGLAKKRKDDNSSSSSSSKNGSPTQSAGRKKKHRR